LIRGGQVVGEGHTAPVGGAHAEVNALRQAGEAARGATLFTTLEPCCHTGLTPPCTEAILVAGVARVVVAVRDPNPRVAGGGIGRLRSAGVPVELGDGAVEAHALYAPFAYWIIHRLPFVTAKYAMTLDGRIATRNGQSRWISGAPARRLVHGWRDRSDAILVGAGTALADDPRLTTRLPAGERPPAHPLRILLDSRGRVPLNARLFDPTLPGRTIVAGTTEVPQTHEAALAERKVELLRLPADAAGRVSLPALLATLGEREITTLLVEGGAAVLGAFFAGDHVHRLHSFIAPKIVGGATAPGPVGDPGVLHMDEARTPFDSQCQSVGDDWLISAEMIEPWTIGAPAPADGAAAAFPSDTLVSTQQKALESTCSPALSKS
jgi:diaminohydroxyphosphoribosylaminopyrimidine deaminase/5-amino-6-(5-phosphoribosylamino)uracil reductase